MRGSRARVFVRAPFRLVALAVLACVLTVRPAAAEEEEPTLWLHLNGHTTHFSGTARNDNLFGAGLTWVTTQEGRRRAAWELDAFEDSSCHLAAYVGRSWRYQLDGCEVGLLGALMYHRNFERQTRLKVLPILLPMVEFGSRIRVRAYYIPPFRDRRDEQIALQLLVPLGR